MWENIVQLNEEGIKGQRKQLVRGGIEKTCNEPLASEAEKRTQDARHERNERLQGYRNGYCNRNLTTTFGEVTLKALKPKEILWETPSLSGIHTNNVIERLNRETRRRTRVIGPFPGR